MDERAHIVFGALLHDVGKLFERAEMLAEYRRDEDQEQADCPWNEKGRYWSHKHVLHTRRFCEELEKRCPVLQPTPGSDQNWINIAARHHKASQPLELLVTAADHFASAEREAGNFYVQRVHQKTRLEPIMARVNLEGRDLPGRFRQPLGYLELTHSAIFPKDAEKFGVKMKDQGNNVWLSGMPLVSDYFELANGFLGSLDVLPQPAKARRAAYRSLFQSLLSLMERFMSQVPAATNVRRPDISLFDHLRVTAAIAEGLYHHHAYRNSLDEPRSFHDRKTAKWRLVCGDFSGIQSFIYRITSKGAAKALRGRSLYIQLLCDAVSERLLRDLDLYPTARIYSSGGKFYLLISDCMEGKLRNLVTEVNAWLLDEFGGDVFLGIGIAEVRGNDFREGAMGLRWKEANDDLMRDREMRFKRLAFDRADFFEPQPLHPQGSCQVCGRDDGKAELRTDDSGSQNRQICSQCDRLERLGGRLAKTDAFFWAWDDDRHRLCDQWHEAWRFSFDGIGCDLYLLGDSNISPPSGLSLTLCHKEALNDPDCLDGNPYGYSCGFRFLGLWNRNKESGEWDFERFAGQARGIRRMGVLRMDVDNLGKIFASGLRFTDAAETKDMGSLSRVATLSRQLHLFFAGYLNTLVASFPRSQIIYAGGDDLFLVGSWDELPVLAAAVREAFSAYACYNNSFTVSGGMILVPGKYPISRSAELAGEEESRAKSLRREDGRAKNAFCLLETPIPWEDFASAVSLKELIADLASKENRAIIDRLRRVVIALQEHERRGLGQLADVSREALSEAKAWQRWRWQLVYNLNRMVRRTAGLELSVNSLQRAILDSVVDGNQTVQPVLDWLQMPVRWAEFSVRREKDDLV